MDGDESRVGGESMEQGLAQFYIGKKRKNVVISRKMLHEDGRVEGHKNTST